MTHLWSFSVCQLSNKDSKPLSHQLVFYVALKQDFEAGRQCKETESKPGNSNWLLNIDRKSVV